MEARDGELAPLRRVAESVRAAFLEAALDAWEDALIRGLCREGAWEAAVGAVRAMDLTVDRPALRVRDAMTAEVATLAPDDPTSLAEDLMRVGRVRHLPVVDGDGRIQGLVSQRDLLRRGPLDRERAAAPVSQVMTRDVVVSAPDAPLRDAASEMLRGKLGCLPVLEDGVVVGILTEADFVRLAL